MYSPHVDPPEPQLGPRSLELVLPKRSTLDGFAVERGCADGVAVQSLAPGAVVTVKTRHSSYRMVVVDGPERKVLISGGRVFPESTAVRVAGATAGGSAVKVGWIGEGLRLELATDLGRVTTSRVESIVVDEEAAEIAEP